MKRAFLFMIGVLLMGVFIFRKKEAILAVMMVLIYTAAFSLLLAPVCAKLERHGVRQSRAAVYAVIGLFLIIIVLVSTFIPYLVTKSIHLFKRLEPVASALVQRWTGQAEGFLGIRSLLADPDGLFGITFSGIAEKLVRAGMTAASQIGKVFFSLVLTYYVLCDRKRIGRHLLLCVPLAWRDNVLGALQSCGNAMLSYFSGLLKTSAFVAAATAAGLLLLGVQDAILLAVLMGVFEILPYLGPILASVPILLSALMQGGKTALLVLILLVLVQQIEGNFITPYFTASSTSIHPLAAILSVFVGGNLLGFWGILLAIPVVVLMQNVFWSARQTWRVMESQTG